MVLPVFPASDLDIGDNLLSALGSFWLDVYAGNDLVRDFLLARAGIEKQAYDNLQELLQTLSRHNVPVWHTENWSRLVLNESERNDSKTTLARYDDPGVTYGAGYRYDIPFNRPDSAFPAPSQLANCLVICDHLLNATVVFVRDIDFIIEEKNQAIIFSRNPFDNEELAKRDVLQGGVVVDRQIELWLYHAQYDHLVYADQYGYILGYQQESSENYKELMNAVFDALVEGSAKSHLERSFSAIMDVPLVKTDGEVVELITQDQSGKLVITNRYVYRYTFNSIILVKEGDTVNAGQSLTDALQIYEFNRGQVPIGLRALAIGPGILDYGYYQDLVFENMDVPLVVTTDAGGYTRVEFQVGGFPADVELFWDTVHAKGIESGQTLAHLLDVRANPTSEPTADSLPATINPLEFLIQNFLRNNAFLVRLKLTKSGVNSLGLGNTQILRKIIPPHTEMIVLVELGFTGKNGGDEIYPENNPAAGDIGMSETLTPFVALSGMSESVNPNTYLTETLRIRVMSGFCA